MKTSCCRRDFLVRSAAFAGTCCVGRRLLAAEQKPSLRKALIGKPSEKTFASWKAAGFEGMETTVWDASPAEATAARKTAESQGMQIHSVMRGWANFNSSNVGKIANDLESVRSALRAAAAYGAGVILLVPCRLRGNRVPQPWEFDIRFDEKTGHLQQVVAGDNGPYRDYMAAHDHATDRSRAAIEKLIPVAEKTGVVIALENVWNNLWVKPAIFANFVRSFDSPWVRAYYDIGNHVKYAPSPQWIRALGPLIVRCHVKDFRLKRDGHGGRFCNIREGSVDWPAVCDALAAIGYSGWMTIEGSAKLSLQEQNERLDLILAGK